MEYHHDDLCGCTESIEYLQYFKYTDSNSSRRSSGSVIGVEPDYTVFIDIVIDIVTELVHYSHSHREDGYDASSDIDSAADPQRDDPTANEHRAGFVESEESAEITERSERCQCLESCEFIECSKCSESPKCTEYGGDSSEFSTESAACS